jgi:NAD(P)-dependent dehydrogenase (short-subunit alcohol dehydrogenase family)
MDLGLDGKGVLLVGGTAGVGRAVARLLAGEGARMVLSGRHAESLAATESELKNSLGANVKAVQSDVTSADQVEALVATARSYLGRIDVLIHTAGDSWKRDILTVTDEQMHDTWALNLLGPIRSIRAVVSQMQDRAGGAIVVLGAVSGKQPIPGFVPGNTSKAGLLALVKGLASDLAPMNIRINNVCPGRCATERWMNDAEKTSQQLGVSVDEFVREKVKDIPMQRLAQPDEVASCVVFLASDRASYITGQSVSVDGGWGKSII